MKILLVCNAGMSSSILIDKIKQAAEERNVDITISASSTKGLDDEVGSWDICLIGPQISYAAERIRTKLQIPVLPIEPRIYALADGNQALDMAIRLFEANK